MEETKEITSGRFACKSIFLYLLVVPAYIIYPLTQNIRRYTVDIFEPGHKTIIESQRGYTPETYENTLEGIQRAIDLKLESVSCDVWYTKDKIPVLVRGAEWGELDDYFGTHEQVTKMTWDKLSKLKSNRGGFQITKLIDVIELCKGKIFLNIILRDFRVEVIFPLLSKWFEKYDLFEQVMISSEQLGYHFRINEYNDYYENDNKICFGFMFEKGDNKRYEFDKPGHAITVHWSEITPELIKNAHDNMMAVHAFFDNKEEENEERYEMLLRSGVDVIGSFNAKEAEKYRDKYYKLH